LPQKFVRLLELDPEAEEYDPQVVIDHILAQAPESKVTKEELVAAFGVGRKKGS
jgi:hypothetical protein